MSFRQLSGAAKVADVTKLLDLLQKDLQEKKIPAEQKLEFLLQLRQYGTNPVDAGPIYCREGIRLLTEYGVNGESPEICRAALRCVANALLLDPKMRQILVGTEQCGKIVDMLKSDNSEDEMVASRLLFLITYDTSMTFQDLLKDHSLANNVDYQLGRHAKQFPETGKQPLSQMDELALTDTLKFVFNVCKVYDHSAAFTQSIPHILTIVRNIDIHAKPLDGLLGHLINALSVLNLDQREGDMLLHSAEFPESNPSCNVDKLVKILDQGVSEYTLNELEEKSMCLMLILMKMYMYGPEDVKLRMHTLLLPDEKDRSQPVGKSDTLSSRLLELSTSSSMNLRTTISELMFILTDKDPENLIRKIGYGYGAGLLAARGMEAPQPTGEAGGFDSEINPITGQRWDAEPQDQGPPMTEEEKEREAERLFVLFERARANGILGVENPVTQALHEGRFEELPDDADSDDAASD